MSEPLIKGGYILLSRKTIESEIFHKPHLYLKVWIYLLVRAQHKNYKKLKKGQLVTSIPEIQEACSYYVGYRKETPSKKQVYDILEWLRNPRERNHEGNDEGTMIVTTKGTQCMVVTIDKYVVYQTPRNYEGNAEGNDEKRTKGLRQERQGNNINKNDKNDTRMIQEKDSPPSASENQDQLPDGVIRLEDGSLDYSNVKRSW